MSEAKKHLQLNKKYFFEYDNKKKKPDFTQFFF